MNKLELLSNSLVNNSVLNEVKAAHPKQVISNEIEIPVWKISYKYLTQRNNEKEAVKYLLNKSEAEWDGVENDFKWYINNFNESNPDRQLSNVEILDIEYLDKLIIDLE